MDIYAIGIELPSHQADKTHFCLFKLCRGDKVYWEHVETYENKREALKDIDRVCGCFIKRGYHNTHPFNECHITQNKEEISGHIRSSS